MGVIVITGELSNEVTADRTGVTFAITTENGHDGFINIRDEISEDD